MRLVLHPDTPCDAISAIDVTATRPATTALTLLYSVRGRRDAVRLPAVTTPARRDRLWQTTCFEAFVGLPDAPAYTELNFAPSHDWAAYRFADYRDGMQLADQVSDPAIDLALDDGGFTLRVDLDIGMGIDPWLLGISAVIEETEGRKSYWALAHPPGKPDFHHRDCFVLELSAA